mmetsp:Transcript_39010/g.49797  ORF Transcript_39010/g.49797 Transcript_39010/m.49797 type:complete len:797 (+) Transcript_39010:608-2998(+)
MAHSSLGELDSEIQIGTITLLIKDASDKRQKKRKLEAKTWSTVKDVKDLLQQRLHVPISRQRLYFRGRELRNAHSLATCGIYTDNETLDLAIAPEPGDALVPHCAPFGDHCPKPLNRTINQVQRALELNLVPELAMEGTGGTYFMKDSRKRVVGCFKPQDEEPFMVNNPRGFEGGQGPMMSMRPGVRAGEACIREVAAYLMDHKGFAGVPATSLVFAQHSAFKYADGNVQPKLGSFQEFVDHDECVGDLAPSKLPTKEVHKIAILDLRLLNGDRNDANLLVRRRRRKMGTNPEAVHGNGSFDRWEIELIPIDHGYCLPDKIEIGWCDLCWLEWPQLKEPLDRNTRRYVEKLDPAAEAKRLAKKLDLRAPCLRNCQAAHMLLVGGVKAGLNLHQIANIVARQDLDVPSEFEMLLEKAHELVRFEMYNSRILNHVINSHTGPKVRPKLYQKSPGKHQFIAPVLETTEAEAENPALDSDSPTKPLTSRRESSSGNNSSQDNENDEEPSPLQEGETSHQRTFRPVTGGGTLPIRIPSPSDRSPANPILLGNVLSETEDEPPLPLGSKGQSPEGTGFWVRDMSEIDHEIRLRCASGEMQFEWSDEEETGAVPGFTGVEGFAIAAASTGPGPTNNHTPCSYQLTHPLPPHRAQTSPGLGPISVEQAKPPLSLPPTPALGLSEVGGVIVGSPTQAGCLDLRGGSSSSPHTLSPPSAPSSPMARPMQRVASYSGFASPAIGLGLQQQPAPAAASHSHQPGHVNGQLLQQRNGRSINVESKLYGQSFFNFVDILLQDLFNRHKHH